MIYITVGKYVSASDFDKKFVGEQSQWPIKKGALTGDTVFFLIGTEFIATGRVASEKSAPWNWGGSKKIVRDISDIAMLDSIVPLSDVRDAIPKWGWCRAKQPMQTSVPEKFQERFLKVLNNASSATDAPEPPEKYNAQTKRFIRDTPMVNNLKIENDFKCHVKSCSFSLDLPNGKRYIEGHHLKPLHKGGLDVRSNILILCPNHHASFDYRIPVFVNRNQIRFGSKLASLRSHELDPKFIAFHNWLAGSTAPVKD